MDWRYSWQWSWEKNVMVNNRHVSYPDRIPISCGSKYSLFPTFLFHLVRRVFCPRSPLWRVNPTIHLRGPKSASKILFQEPGSDQKQGYGPGSFHLLQGIDVSLLNHLASETPIW